MRSFYGVAFTLIALMTWWIQTDSLVAQSFISHSRLVLGTESNKSASLRIGDLDGDRDLDVVVANGRHWPQQNFAFLNQGTARFNVMRPLGEDRSTSYACELADLDGDGDLDIAVGNDMAPCQIFLNDGQARFTLEGTFGGTSSVRSMTIVDIDRDGDQDILLTCRGRSNRICLNDGRASFDKEIEFGTKTDSTIDVEVGDVNGDQHLDLLLANRVEKSVWLLGDGNLKFDRQLPFGEPRVQSRSVAVGDFNKDGDLDWAIGNIGKANQVFLGDGTGGYVSSIEFGRPDGRTYCLRATDLDGDGDLDLVAGNAGQSNSLFFNQGDGTRFRTEVLEANEDNTYGLDVGDFNSDGKPDLAFANSDAPNQILLNRTVQKTDEKKRAGPLVSSLVVEQKTPRDRAETQTTDWPAFRGDGGRGVADGHPLPSKWKLGGDADEPENILWSVNVPGLGHSSPVIVGEKLFLITAVAQGKEAPLQVQSGGRPTAADDNGLQDWLLLCYDKSSGKMLWKQTLHRGEPRATRHAKATHANTSVCVAGDKLITFLGSEGLFCHDLKGEQIWKQDLGVVNISKYGIGWGFSSSPTVFDNQIVLVCDDPENPFLAARSLGDGTEIWRTSRQGICERSWGTPLVHQQDGMTQVVVNGWPWIMSYNLADGKEIWRIKGGGDNPVPSPFVANGLIFITNAHGGPSPIYAVRPTARGNLETSDDKGIAWSVEKGGSYMSTPVVYGDQLYVGDSRGVVRTFDAGTGEKLMERRLGRNSGVIASLVAGDGKIYVASENGTVYVFKHGRELEMIAKNNCQDPCLATPAISDGVLFVRTTKQLIAIKDEGEK
ncbi:MAG: FG-GAP-like repeat-containing protein [Planctomycetota bacterium]